jgi:hypothetical protein
MVPDITIHARSQRENGRHYSADQIDAGRKHAALREGQIEQGPPLTWRSWRLDARTGKLAIADDPSLTNANESRKSERGAGRDHNVSRDGLSTCRNPGLDKRVVSYEVWKHRPSFPPATADAKYVVEGGATSMGQIEPDLARRLRQTGRSGKVVTNSRRK